MHVQRWACILLFALPGRRRLYWNVQHQTCTVRILSQSHYSNHKKCHERYQSSPSNTHGACYSGGNESYDGRSSFSAFAFYLSPQICILFVSGANQKMKLVLKSVPIWFRLFLTYQNRQTFSYLFYSRILKLA